MLEPQESSKDGAAVATALTPNECLKESLRDLAVQSFIMDRWLPRTIRTLARFAERLNCKEQFGEALYSSFMDDKTFFLKLLEGQLTRLEELKAPAIIVEAKKHQIEAATALLAELRAQSAQDFVDDRLEQLEEERVESAVDASTAFCQSKWPIYQPRGDHEEQAALFLKILRG